MIRMLALLAGVLLVPVACASQPATPPVAAAPQPASSLVSTLPSGGQALDEAYRGLFETCDRTDRFGGIQLPIMANGRTRWFGCRSDPTRLARLERWPDGTVAWVAKLAVDLDGSHYACTTPGLTDLCDTWLMLRDPATGRMVPVDSDRVPYVVIPIAGPARDPGRPGVDVPREFRDRTGIGKGDVGVVLFAGRVVPVLVADGGPFNKVGEGSLALHRALGRELCAARDSAGRCERIVRPLSGIAAGVTTVIFPGTALTNVTPETIADAVAREAMTRWRAFAQR